MNDMDIKKKSSITDDFDYSNKLLNMKQEKLDSNSKNNILLEYVKKINAKCVPNKLQIGDTFFRFKARGRISQ